MTQFNLGKLFLIPSAIDQNNKNEILLDWQAKKIRHIKQFIVENEKAARSILKEIKLHNPIQSLKLFKNSSSTTIDEIEEMLSSIFCGEDMGLLSDSGIPCVADPGSKIVEYAHKNNIMIEPLIGPSSVIMALMSSGFNGQRFSFLGYAPINKVEKDIFFKELESKVRLFNETQIFIETPYRNEQLLKDLIAGLNNHIKLCIASNLTSNEEKIVSMSIAEWKKITLPQLNKKPCIFLVN